MRANMHFGVLNQLVGFMATYHKMRKLTSNCSSWANAAQSAPSWPRHKTSRSSGWRTFPSEAELGRLVGRPRLSDDQSAQSESRLWQLAAQSRAGMRQLERRRYIPAGGSEAVAGLAQRHVVIKGEARHKPGRGVEAAVQERLDEQGAAAAAAPWPRPP